MQRRRTCGSTCLHQSICVCVTFVSGCEQSFMLSWHLHGRERSNPDRCQLKDKKVKHTHTHTNKLDITHSVKIGASMYRFGKDFNFHTFPNFCAELKRWPYDCTWEKTDSLCAHYRADKWPLYTLLFKFNKPFSITFIISYDPSFIMSGCCPWNNLVLTTSTRPCPPFLCS